LYFAIHRALERLDSTDMSGRNNKSI